MHRVIHWTDRCMLRVGKKPVLVPQYCTVDDSSEPTDVAPDPRKPYLGQILADYRRILL